MKYLLLAFMALTLTACYIGHDGWVKLQNKKIGKKPYFITPTKYKDSGKIIRANFLVQGYGLTHITKDKNNNDIQHWFAEEVLSSYNIKDMVGKCKYFLIVDSNHIVIDWGFEDDANPKSCQVWP